MAVEDSVAQDQLRAFVERIERLEEELAAINSDKKEIYAEAKGNGFDVAALKQVIKLRRQDANERMEREAVVELYMAALGMIATPDFDEPRVQVQARVREATTSAPEITPSRPTKAAGQATAAIADSSEEASPSSAESEASGSGTVAAASAQITEPQPAPHAGSDLTSPPNPQGQVADTQPETANEAGDEIGYVAADAPDQGLVDAGNDADNLNPGGENVDAPEVTATPMTEHAPGKPVGASASAAPAAITYPAPGLVVMEHTPPEGIVAHPFAAVWPVNNIDVSEGVREPIVKIGKLMLDGRGRYFAARAATHLDGPMEYPVVQYAGADPLMDCIKWNLASRPNLHLHNLKMIATKLAKLEPARADDIMQAFGLEIAEAAQ